MEMLFVPYHFLQSVITKITGAVIVACSAYFYINGTMSAVYAIGMTILAFMFYACLECAGNYSSLLHVVSVCVDKANAILELDTMDIDGKEIQPENYESDFLMFRFLMTNGRALMIYRSLFRRKRRQQSLDHPGRKINTLQSEEQQEMKN